MYSAIKLYSTLHSTKFIMLKYNIISCNLAYNIRCCSLETNKLSWRWMPIQNHKEVETLGSAGCFKRATDINIPFFKIHLSGNLITSTLLQLVLTLKSQIIPPFQKINKQTKQKQEYTSIPNIPLFTILDLYVQY